MKIVLLADIHGNLPALERVLDGALALGPDKIAVLGDMIGYYYRAAEVLELVRRHADIVILGNHERAYLDILNGRRDPEAYRKKYGHSLDVALETLTQDQNDWLLSLDDSAVVNAGDRRLHLSHEAPGSENGYLYPDAEAAAFDAAAPVDCDAAIFAHTHYPCVVCRPDALLANPGSVGQARDIGGLAGWAVIHPHSMSVELKRTPYDTAPVEHDVMKYDPGHPYLRSVLHRGRP